MNLPVISTPGHQGKSLVINPDQETIIIQDISGHPLGYTPWGVIIDQILTRGDDPRFAASRAQPRAPLAVKVRYTTPEGKQFDGLTAGIGGGGLFIESSSPLPQGTDIAVEFALPDRPWEKLNAKGKVAWTRKKPERYLLFPGMGIQFMDIDQKVQSALVELVEALNRSRTPS